VLFVAPDAGLASGQYHVCEGAVNLAPDAERWSTRASGAPAARLTSL
jgi:hypothetical protein